MGEEKRRGDSPYQLIRGGRLAPNFANAYSLMDVLVAASSSWGQMCAARVD